MAFYKKMDKMVVETSTGKNAYELAQFTRSNIVTQYNDEIDKVEMFLAFKGEFHQLEEGFKVVRENGILSDNFQIFTPEEFDKTFVDDNEFECLNECECGYSLHDSLDQILDYPLDYLSESDVERFVENFDPTVHDFPSELIKYDISEDLYNHVLFLCKDDSDLALDFFSMQGYDISDCEFTGIFYDDLTSYYESIEEEGYDQEVEHFFTEPGMTEEEAVAYQKEIEEAIEKLTEANEMEESFEKGVNAVIENFKDENESKEMEFDGKIDNIEIENVSTVIEDEVEQIKEEPAENIEEEDSAYEEIVSLFDGDKENTDKFLVQIGLDKEDLKNRDNIEALWGDIMDSFFKFVTGKDL